MRFLDTNIILDLLGPADATGACWSRERYGDALVAGPVICNIIVLAELASHASSSEALMDRLRGLEIEQVDLATDAAFASGRAFRDYRRRGGAREAILADFLIAGHAAALGATFVTRDRRIARYFPDLLLITPETQP